MQNSPETPYFVYLYVFTCEQCSCPHVSARILASDPQDYETDREPAEWFCENCKSPQSTALYRSAVYAKKLLVKNGECSERSNGGAVLQS
jgi:hypothetical protein